MSRIALLNVIPTVNPTNIADRELIRDPYTTVKPIHASWISVAMPSQVLADHVKEKADHAMNSSPSKCVNVKFLGAWKTQSNGNAIANSAQRGLVAPV